jgi:hypothetical protein
MTPFRRLQGSASELAFYAQLPDLLCRGLSQRRCAEILFLTVLLGMWQGANAAGFWWEAMHPRALAHAH